MNIIEQLGGYVAAMVWVKEHKKHGVEFSALAALNVRQVENALLEYRRANNIFEVGGPVTHIETGLRGTVSPQEFGINYIFIDFPDEDFVECRYSEVRHVEIEVLNDIDIPPNTIILGDK